GHRLCRARNRSQSVLIGGCLALAPRMRIAAILGAAALVAMGCAPTVKSASESAARGATPAAVESGLSKFEDPTTRQKLVTVMATPEMRTVVHDVSADAAQGI